MCNWRSKCANWEVSSWTAKAFRVQKKNRTWKDIIRLRLKIDEVSHKPWTTFNRQFREHIHKSPNGMVKWNVRFTFFSFVASYFVYNIVYWMMDAFLLNWLVFRYFTSKALWTLLFKSMWFIEMIQFFLRRMRRKSHEFYVYMRVKLQLISHFWVSFSSWIV